MPSYDIARPVEQIDPSVDDAMTLPAASFTRCLQLPPEHDHLEKLDAAGAAQGDQDRAHERLLEERREGALPQVDHVVDHTLEPLGQPVIGAAATLHPVEIGAHVAHGIPPRDLGDDVDIAAMATAHSR